MQCKEAPEQKRTHICKQHSSRGTGGREELICGWHTLPISKQGQVCWARGFGARANPTSLFQHFESELPAGQPQESEGSQEDADSRRGNRGGRVGSLSSSNRLQ